MKQKLDELRKKYEVKDFIKDDPIQFPHLFKTIEDIEISGFLSAAFAYGKRELFIEKLKTLFEIMDNKPLEFILNIKEEKDKLDNFVYRFYKGSDLVSVLMALNKLYANKKNLRELFYNSKKQFNSFQGVCNYFYSSAPNLTKGLCHFIPNPSNGCAMKRVNMFLRWMTRDGEVDLGVWDIYKKSELLIPLDVHVGNVSREFKLLSRNSNDMKATIELTQKLKEYNPNDPVGYDFALFGLGVNR